MRQIRYGVAMSLDGYIADAKGGFDWIVADPDIDFAAIMARYDTLLMGRRTYEVTKATGDGSGDAMPGVTTVVVSRTLKQRDHPDVRIVSENWEDAVRELREKPGKDIWLFGGGALFGASSTPVSWTGWKSPSRGRVHARNRQGRRDRLSASGARPPVRLARASPSQILGWMFSEEMDVAFSFVPVDARNLETTFGSAARRVA